VVIGGKIAKKWALGLGGFNDMVSMKHGFGCKVLRFKRTFACNGATT
jgi:hypothetical protein